VYVVTSHGQGLCCAVYLCFGSTFAKYCNWR